MILFLPGSTNAAFARHLTASRAHPQQGLFRDDSDLLVQGVHVSNLAMYGLNGCFKVWRMPATA
jgi:hypothetical protein